MVTTDIFSDFVSKHWPSDEAQWFKKLARSGWLAADWPIALGGTGWTRQKQLNFITALSACRCPVMPDSVNVIAPLLLAYGSTEQKQYFLPRILESPEVYRFQSAEKVGPGCFLDHDSGNLHLISDGGSATPLGPGFDATAILATTYSPLWLLYERLLGLAHLQKMSEYWEEETSTELATFKIETSSLIGSFLQKTANADRQIGLRVSRDRNNLNASLFQTLGYYALLSPDATLVSNEPLPFSAERAYLQAVRKQVTRDNMIQQDQLYKKHVNNADT